MMRWSLAVVGWLATPTLAGLLLGRAWLQPAPDGRPALRPTPHPPVPARLDQLWLVPPAAEAATLAARFAGFQEGVRAYLAGEHEKALAWLEQPAWRDTEVGGYAAYYAGLARVGLGHLDAALDTFRAIVEARPSGYLVEAATLAGGEVLDALDRESEAVQWYERLLARKTVETADVLYRLARAALAIGDRRKAGETLIRVYDEFPVSEQARRAATDLEALADAVAVPGTHARYAKDVQRAEALTASSRWEEARAAWLRLRAFAPAADRLHVDLRLAACDVALRRYRAARDRLRPYLRRATAEQAELRYVYLTALRGLGRTSEFVAGARAITAEFPDSPWTEAALDLLATHYIVNDQDERAVEVFRNLYVRFPAGRRADRAAWKVGWWAYRRGDLAEALRYFEGAAATFPRSDYRPAFLYWAGRARAQAGDPDGARDRLAIAVADYGGSYYGRLAARALQALGGSSDGGNVLARPRGTAEAPPIPTAATLPTASLIRTLIALERYDAALGELNYARAVWGSSPALEAAVAFVLHRQGDYRRAAALMRRAYPQVLTAANGGLPEEVLKVVFPLDYWELIRKHAANAAVDPYLVAALVAQESMFDAGARSSANARGLMQIVPATGRRLGRALGLRRVALQMLEDPDTNLRLGTRHLAELLQRFGELHLALAAYNAGEQPVSRWVRERPGLAPEVFIDDMPFPETQNYVRRILGTVEDYRRLYPPGAAASTR